MANLFPRGVDSKKGKLNSPVIKKQALTFMFIQFFGFFLFAGYKTIFPLILEIGYSFSEFQVVASWSVIFTISMFIGFLSRFPLGILTDRISRQQALFFGSMTCLISIIGILFTENIN